MTDQQTQPTSKEAAPPEAEKAHPWAELGPEQFSLLRLAPLPIDRHTGPRPLRFIQMGRLERQSPRQSLLRLTLQLPGQKVRKEQNVLELWLDHRTKDHQHNLVRYTTVIPWTMLRFGREMALVVTYEDWQNRDGSTAVYSFCRLYFFDEKGKINNFVFTRRRVHPVGRYPLVD